MEYSPKKMKDLFESNQFKLKKKFGQNFIIDENIIHAIVEKSAIDSDTVVVEIGPGAGSLTNHLARSAKWILGYEIDSSLKPILDHTLVSHSNVTIYYQDFLTCDIKKDLEPYHNHKIYLVANLPYYITTPIIMKVIEEQLPIDKIVIMVQKEVGNRFKAEPGNKDYGSLSVFLNYYFKIKKLMDVSCNVFMPKPNVDSIVVQFERKDPLLDVHDMPFFFQLIRSSFTQKRKTLRNNLHQYPLDQIELVLKEHQLDLSVRAEAMPLELFVEIANKLK